MCGGSNVEYVQSKEQKELYQQLQPLMQKLVSGDTYDVGNAPTYSGYDVPDTTSMMPTANWWDELDPNIKAGIKQPYEEGSNQLAEQLMSYGQGSVMGGASGVMGSSLADYWADAGTQMATTGWNMVSPALQAGWSANLDKNKTTADYKYQSDMAKWTADLNKAQLPYSVMSGLYSGTYSTPVVSQPWYSSLLGGASSAGTAWGLGKIG